MSSYESDLALALRLADLADSIALPRFLAQDLVVETKPDASPVTDADRSVEAALKQVLAEERPEDALIGEEFGNLDHRPDRRHRKLYARSAGLGRTDCPRRRRQACCQRGFGTGPRAPLVGRSWRWCAH